MNNPPTPTPAPANDAAEWIKNAAIEIRRSFLFNVNFVETKVAAIIACHAPASPAVAEEAITALRQQLAGANQELEMALEFKKLYEVADDARLSALRKVVSANARADAAEARVKEAEEENQRLQNILSGFKNPIAPDYSKRCATLEIELHEMEVRAVKAESQLTAQQAKIAELEKALASGINGKLTRAGTFPIRDEETTGLVISMDIEALASIQSLPMYREVIVVPVAALSSARE